VNDEPELPLPDGRTDRDGVEGLQREMDEAIRDIFERRKNDGLLLAWVLVMDVSQADIGNSSYTVRYAQPGLNAHWRDGLLDAAYRMGVER
jgi:hypothetical protein